MPSMHIPWWLAVVLMACTVNPSTGALTTIGDFDLGSGFNDLAFHLGPLPCD